MAASRPSHTNWMRTERVRTDQSDTIRQDCTSGPFGDGESCSNGTPWSPHRYAGYERDDETGLDHMWFRYYNPKWQLLRRDRRLRAFAE